MHRWADRGDREPTPGPSDAVERADALVAALRAAFGGALRCDATALPSGAVDASVVVGSGSAVVLASPDGARWGVTVDRSGADPAAGPDQILASVDEVVAVLRTHWPVPG